MSTPNLPEQVNVRTIDNLNADPDSPEVEVRHCPDHGFEGPVEIYRYVMFTVTQEEWRCPGIGGEDAHDIITEVESDDPDRYRDGDF